MNPYNNLNDFIKMAFPENKSASVKFVTSQPVSYPALDIPKWAVEKLQKQEGNTPMATNKYSDAAAVATIQAQPSSEQITRDYLLSRLRDVRVQPWSNKGRELRKLFNLDTDNTPKTYKELIDAIKNDKFSLDEKAIKRHEEDVDDFGEDFCDYDFRGPFAGIIFDGPKPDLKGYDQAIKDYEKLYVETKDTIMVFPAEDGLKALQAFEAWQPTKSDTQAS